MSRSHRLFDIMQILRRHRRPVTGKEIGWELGVSLRTVYRDIATLQSMGAEIDGEAGVGFVLRPGFLLPPLMFSEEEIQALAIGADWVGKQTDLALARAAQNAIGKIAAVLPPDLRVLIHDDSLQILGKAPADPAFDLATVRLAMRQQSKIQIAYRDVHLSFSDRTIWPISVGFVDRNRYLAGWCELRAAFRMFRADRIESLAVLADRYPGRRHDLVRQWRAQDAVAA
jgi:predicted DNA-binding transcriptional regulator YafY